MICHEGGSTYAFITNVELTYFMQTITKGLLRAEEITETRKSFTNKPIMRVSECTYLCTSLCVYICIVCPKNLRILRVPLLGRITENTKLPT